MVFQANFEKLRNFTSCRAYIWIVCFRHVVYYFRCILHYSLILCYTNHVDRVVLWTFLFMLGRTASFFCIFNLETYTKSLKWRMGSCSWKVVNSSNGSSYNVVSHSIHSWTLLYHPKLLHFFYLHIGVLNSPIMITSSEKQK